MVTCPACAPSALPCGIRTTCALPWLLDNTNLEICAANDRGEWLRVQGTANFDNTPEAQAAAFQVMPQLADLYNEETGHKLGIVYLDHLSARLFSMSGVVKDIMNY